MKKFDIVYLRRAQEDLEGIFNYIRKDSPTHAKTWINKIDREISRVAAFPESGAIPKDNRIAALGYRMIIIDDYLAFYLIRKHRVEIQRVLHGRQKYSFLL
ncbi:MAG: type II toxin-antitoxin system RelE/ParE family toxin [Elusimicrobiota bacterium]